MATPNPTTNASNTPTLPETLPSLPRQYISRTDTNRKSTQYHYHCICFTLESVLLQCVKDKHIPLKEENAFKLR